MQLIVLHPVHLCWGIVSHFGFILMLAAVRRSFTLAVHGGVGVRSREQFQREPELEQAYRDGIRAALQRGYEQLAKGGTAVDAVEQAVREMEDNPLFNAGRGASFTIDGVHELDAAIMDGKSLRAGAVAAVTGVKNPISLARLVMELTPHVLLTGGGAMRFAREQEVEMRPPEYFFTERKWRALQDVLEKDITYGKLETGEVHINDADDSVTPEEKQAGTVGAVAVDSEGNLAAATSTGGITKKMPGRVGDSPIIGAGTYANNATCAVSATGLGEKLMLLVTGKEVSALMEFKGYSLYNAAETVVFHRLMKIGGSGGLVAVDRQGNVAMPYNTKGMYRGYIRNDGSPRVYVFEE